MPIIKIFILIVSFLFCIGCMQDPFGSYPESIRNATPHEEINPPLVIPHRMVSEDFAQITASHNDLWRASVGNEFSMVITSRIFLDEEDFDDFIVEIVSPPLIGEVYSFREIQQVSSKEKRYLFKWTPSRSFTGDHLKKAINLRFQVRTAGRLNLNKLENFPVIVYRTSLLVRPEVTSITMPSILEDGEGCVIQVQVFDINSNENHPPIIEFINMDEDYDLTDLIAFVDKKMISQYLWEFEFHFKTEMLDEINRDSIHYKLGVQARSHFNVPSLVKASHFTIIKDQNNIPQITGPTNITVYTGTQSHFQLHVEDQLRESLSIQIIVPQDQHNIPGSFEYYTQEKDEGFDITVIWKISEQSLLPHLDTDTDIESNESNQYNLKIEITNSDNGEPLLHIITAHVNPDMPESSVNLFPLIEQNEQVDNHSDQVDTADVDNPSDHVNTEEDVDNPSDQVDITDVDNPSDDATTEDVEDPTLEDNPKNSPVEDSSTGTQPSADIEAIDHSPSSLTDPQVDPLSDSEKTNDEAVDES